MRSPRFRLLLAQLQLAAPAGRDQCPQTFNEHGPERAQGSASVRSAPRRGAPQAGLAPDAASRALRSGAAIRLRSASPNLQCGHGAL